MNKKIVLLYSRRETDHILTDLSLPDEELDRIFGEDKRRKGGRLKILKPLLRNSDIDLIVATNPLQFRESIDTHVRIDAILFYRLIYVEGEVPDVISQKGKIIDLIRKSNVGIEELLALASKKFPYAYKIIFRYGQMPTNSHYDKAMADIYARLIASLEAIESSDNSVHILRCMPFEDIINEGFGWFRRVLGVGSNVDPTNL